MFLPCLVIVITVLVISGQHANANSLNSVKYISGALSHNIPTMQRVRKNRGSLVVNPFMYNKPMFAASSNISQPGNEKPNTSPADFVCEIYSNLTRNKESGWALRITNNIISGNETQHLEYPHMVALGYKPIDVTNKFEYNCAGSIISKLFVLTAAHCCDSKSPPLIIRAGTINIAIDEDIDADSLIVKIATIILHPDYHERTLRHDIALLQLHHYLDFSDAVHPACLYTNKADVDNSTNLVIIGWGISNFETEEKSTVLLKTTVTPMHLDLCNKTLYDYNIEKEVFDPRLRNGLNPGQICAFDPEGERDTCEGDSGGPIQIDNSELFGQSTVAGITSFGLYCGTKYPGIYTRVAYYIDWIESNVWPTNQSMFLI